LQGLGGHGFSKAVSAILSLIATPNNGFNRTPENCAAAKPGGLGGGAG
jgi:hypothetical protein